MPEKSHGSASTINLSYIQGWVGDSSYHKGLSYFQDGAIYNARRQGNTLKAHCRGSSAAYYLVEVTLQDEKPTIAECSCPVGGRCKHVAALLLAWANDPGSFQPIEELHIALEKRSKEELVALILQMLKRAPELDSLLQIPIPGAKAKRKQLDPDVIRKQVHRAFKNAYARGWYDTGEIVNDLDILVDLAGQYQAAGEYSQAAIVFQQMLDAAEEYDQILVGDESGSLGYTLGDCALGLGDCLEHITDAGERESLLESLLDYYILDLKQGGIGLADEVPGVLCEQASPAERIILVKMLKRKGQGISDWARPNLGGLELDLLGDQVDDETYLRICRESGRDVDLVSRLLALKRYEDAISAARAAASYHLLTLASLLVQHDLAEPAEELVKEQLVQNLLDRGHREWLLKLYEGQQRQADALSMAQEIFWQSASVSNYQKMQQLAESLSIWPALRKDVITRMEREGLFGALTHIYIHEEEIDLALQTLGQAQKAKHAWYDRSLRMEVARAARKTRPREAILLYLEEVEGIIRLHGRENYVAAAHLLKEVQALYLKLGEAQKWQVEIAALRERHRSLPALKDELNKAGL